jgi:hypothetical protein
MPYIFDLEIYNKHAVIKNGESNVLIDTGSPITIHTDNTLSFLGNDFAAHTNYGGMSIRDISSLVGDEKEISTLVGMDILSRYDVLFDYQNNVISFDNENIELEGLEIPIVELRHGIPLIEIGAEGRRFKAYFDTGAALSYLAEPLTTGKAQAGMVLDFHPTMGRYETIVYEIETDMFGHSRIYQYGNLPARLRAFFSNDLMAIIGYDLLKDFKVVFSARRRILKVVPY